MKEQREIWWWEPKWSFRPKLKLAFAPFRNPWLWVRIESAGLLFLGFAFWLTERYPDLELPMVRLLPAALAVPVAVAGAPLLALWWLAPMIAVSRKGFVILQGQHARWLLAQKIRVVQVIVAVPGHPLIRVSTDESTETCGIGRKVNLKELEAFVREVLPTAHFELVEGA